MGVKLVNTHFDYLQTEWKIEVVDTSFSGTATEIKVAAEGAVIEWDGEDRNIMTDGLRPSICSFGIIVEATNTALNTYLESIVLYSEQRVFMNLYKKVSGTFVLMWKGMVNQTGFEFPDEGDYTFTMTANDGFAKLRDQRFDYLSTSGDNISLIEAITKALSYNGIYSQVGSGDVWVSSALNLYARNQRKTRGVLFDSQIRKESFYEDIDSSTPYTCYEVIDRILKSFGAQMKMWDGRYYIYRAADLRLTTVTVYNYNRTGAWINTTTYAPALTFPIANTRYPFNPIQYTFDQAYKQVIINWNAVSKFKAVKLVPPPFNQSELLLSITDPSVSRAPYKFTSDINTYYSRQRGLASSSPGSPISQRRGAVGADVAPKEVEYSVFYSIRSGNNYIKLISNQAVWVNNPADKSIRFDAKVSADTVSKIHNELYFPPPPLGSTNISIRVVAVLRSGAIKTNFNAQIFLQQQVNSAIGQNPLTFIDDSSEPKYEDVKTVTHDNVNSGSLNVINTTDIALSDEPFLSLNALRVSDGTNWVIPNLWQQDTLDVQYLTFTKMYARELMRVYQTPLYKCTGVFFMDQSFTVMKTITWRGRVLFFNAGKFSTGINEWDGEFVQINYNANARPISATIPTVGTINQRLINDIQLMKAQIEGISQNLVGLNNSMTAVVKDVNNITQTRSQNADKYLIDNVEGIPESGGDVNSTWPLKAEVTATGVKLKFFSA